ncbi:MAG: cardiolipin synthase, partial [Planctomycetes bacterium]|nr:cardiolipin synthase [Planctomycetota bacterium]MBI3272878.1 cardiolipin synthase [Planctomycetota bacterium]
RGMLHAKTTTVDGRWSTVGSANMDTRSFCLNFETNAVIYGRELAAGLERQFEEDLKGATVVKSGGSRSRRRRLLEACCRVLAPLL